MLSEIETLCVRAHQLITMSDDSGAVGKEWTHLLGAVICAPANVTSSRCIDMIRMSYVAPFLRT